MASTARVLPLLIAVASLSSVGCVDDDGSSVIFAGVIAPDDECVYAPDQTQLLFGRLNLDLATEYRIVVQFNNQLIPQVSNAPLRGETNGVFIQGAEVEIKDAALDTISFAGLPNPFTIRSSGFIQPGGATTAALEVIPPVYFDPLKTITQDGSVTIVVEVRAFGETSGKIDIEVDDFTWPVTLTRQFDLGLACTADTELNLCSPFANGAGLVCNCGADSSFPGVCLGGEICTNGFCQPPPDEPTM
ncbi:MAG: hypothetical protein AAGF12_32835 [Myxococcota bacterium]